MTGRDALLLYDVLDSAPEIAFDDIVMLAADLCAVPTALVSLIDTDRQWFKARVGFPHTQTDLDRSVCRHVVAEARTIVIPDLTQDPRTADNALVTGEPHIRFYAGAPLLTRFGAVGALCVIDIAVRPGGLTPEQQDGLERLARQVVLLLEARRDAADLRAALAARDALAVTSRATEARWRELYEKMDQGFIYARALRDEAGVVYDWRYEDVNAAWSKVSGFPAEQARGRSARQLLPALEEEWVTGLARVVDTHQPHQLTAAVGPLGRWYVATAQWVGGDDFTVIFQDITGRVARERRRDALLALSDMLRDSDDEAAMIARAAELVGTALGASRAAYGEMDADRRVVKVRDGWSAPGMPSIAGRHLFESYGSVRDDLLAGRTLIIDDIETDRRTAADAALWNELRVRAVVNVPVAERGRVVALLIVHRAEPHAWTGEEIDFVRDVADRLEIAIGRLRAERQREVLNDEIAHRLKNTLAMVQAVASQTLRHSVDAAALGDFMRRLQALGTAHDALVASRWQAADIGHVIGGVLEALGLERACRVAGPSVGVGARAALSTSMLIHELATNAMKYGALSCDAGRIDVTWRIEDEADPRLVLDWIERGGPALGAPTTAGFGSKLMRIGLAGTGGSTLRFEPTGLEARFEARVDELGQA